jgi:hypothetical protein
MTLAALFTLAAGCAYYRVKEPSTGKTYYTKDIDKHGGTVEFKDAATKTKVRLASSEVDKVTRTEYELHVRDNEGD